MLIEYFSSGAVLDAFLDALLDSLKLLPFLFLTYLLMEFLEHKTSERAERMISRAGRLGPLFGGLLGAVPQCGFSAAASGLYAGRIITVGTLIAVFLSTSDEMLAVMLSNTATNPKLVLKLLTVLGIKLICGAAVGFLIDLIFKRRTAPVGSGDIGDICDKEHCQCEEHGIFLSSLLHTAKIAGFLFAVTFIINTIIFFVGEDRLGAAMHSTPILGEFIAGLIGLIPNCASSVVITELYISGTITAGQLLSGLFCAAGVGVLVLFRTNRSIKENLLITLTLYICGVALGLLVGTTGLAGVLGL